MMYKLDEAGGKGEIIVRYMFSIFNGLKQSSVFLVLFYQNSSSPGSFPTFVWCQ